MKMQSHRNPALIESAMAVPENLPALFRGEMKHGSSNESCSGLKDTHAREIKNGCVNEPADITFDGKENIEDEFFKSPYDFIDQIGIDDLELLQYMPFAGDYRFEF